MYVFYSSTIHNDIKIEWRDFQVTAYFDPRYAEAEKREIEYLHFRWYSLPNWQEKYA